MTSGRYGFTPEHGLAVYAWRRGMAMAAAALVLLSLVTASPAKSAPDDPAAIERQMLSMLDAPLLFVKRHSYRGIHIYDTFYKWPPGGGGIYVLENPSAPRAQWKIRTIIDESSPNSLGKGVYTHPELSWDAKKLLFCYKGTPSGSTMIYEIGIDGQGLRKLSDPTSELPCFKGRGGGQHDIAPSYLPDGRIVFLSTRPSGLVPCNNTGVSILHVMDPDGSNMRPISVNSENEFDPAVLPDGRLVFGRWEYVDKNALTVQSLWSMYPDGTNETAIYANNMVFPEATLDPRPVPGTRLIAITLSKHNSTPRGTIAYLDPFVGKNDPKALFNFEDPKNPTRDTGNSCEPYPLDVNTVLFSGRPRGHRRNVIEMMNRQRQRITVLSDPNICLHAPMLVKPRPVPKLMPDMTDRSKRRGAFFVQNVYEGLHGIERGEAKWLRVIEETSRVSRSPGSRNPYNQTFLVSGALAFATKIYHGMVPINDDGSIYFEAPAGRAIYFQVLDKDKRLIQSMRTFIQAAPGVTRACIGCHEKKSNASSPPLKISRKTLAAGPAKLKGESWGTGYMDYPSMIQPIWDKHCVGCHGGAKGIAARLDLSAGWTEHFNISYENLADRRETQLIAYLIDGIDCMNGTAFWSCQLMKPRSHGSATAPLAKVIMDGDKGHKDRFKTMTETERDLAMTWIDSNGLYYGTWNYTAHGYALAAARSVRGQLAGVMRKAGCHTCHDRYMANDWFNLQKPEFSRILRAPLAKGDKGHGLEICRNHKMDPRRNRIRLLRRGYAHAVRPLSSFAKQPIPPIQKGGKPQPTFASTDDPNYQAMLAIIRRGRRDALARPRVDMPGADVIAGKCRMFIPPPVPPEAPPITVTVDAETGRVRLEWERSARMIGLVSEVHRGKTKDFAPGPKTLLSRSLLAHFVDKKPPGGTVHYALILASGDARSAAARAAVTVPLPKPPAAPAGLTATPAVGSVELQWQQVRGPQTRYHVYRATSPDGPFKPLTAEPIVELRYNDTTAPAGVKHVYAVRAVSDRGGTSAPSQPAAAAALPEVRDPLFVAAFTADAQAALYGGKKAPGTLHGKAKIAPDDKALDLRNGGYATFPHRREFDLTGKFSLACRVKIVRPSQMPIVASCGYWRQAGWFLQRIGSGWRWHVGGIDCDGGSPALGKWTELVCTFDGRTARLYQDGRLVATQTGHPNRARWGKPLYVGQYSGGVDPSFQVNGLISNVRIYGCAVSPKELH